MLYTHTKAHASKMFNRPLQDKLSYEGMSIMVEVYRLRAWKIVYNPRYNLYGFLCTVLLSLMCRVVLLLLLIVVEVVLLSLYLLLVLVFMFIISLEIAWKQCFFVYQYSCIHTSLQLNNTFCILTWQPHTFCIFILLKHTSELLHTRLWL